MKPVKAWAIRRTNGTLLAWDSGIPVAIFKTRQMARVNLPALRGECYVRVEIREVKRRKAAK